MAIYAESDLRGQRGTYNFDSTLKVRDVQPRIALIQPYQAPMISLLSYLGSQPTAAIKFECYEDDLPLPFVTCSGSYLSTALTIQLATGHASRVVLDTQLYNTTTNDAMRIISINTVTDVIGVARSAGGTTAAASNGSADTLVIASEAREEGVPLAPIAITTKAAALFNYTEEFETPVNASWRHMGTRDFTTPDFEYQLKKAVPYHKRKMETAFWLGQRDTVATGSTANHPVTYTGGFDFWVVNNSPAANVINLGNVPLTDTALENWLEYILRYGNPDRKVLFTSPFGRLVITRLAKGPVRTVRGEQTLGMAIVRVEILGFEIPIVTSMLFPLITLGSVIYCADMDYIRMRHLAAQGMNFTTNWFRNVQPRDQKGRKDVLHSDVGLEWKNEFAHGKLSGFTG